MPSKTKLSEGYSTVLPAEIRKALKIAPGDILQWEIDGETIRIQPRKKATLDSITGITSCGGNAVDEKKRSQSGES
jgi:bifunctional DNA-binding transcriptional regulator/antitoxin component of YhaV-PrlF toxin-antitoxin module